MALSKLKTKAKAKPKVKAKAKSKPKSKPKSKLKALPKKKVTKLKTKRKTVKKPKAKKVVKKVVKAKTKPTLKKSKTTSKRSQKPKKFSIDFSAQQKAGLLTTIAKIVDLHKSDKDGLKSLTRVDRIIDQYNQHYTKPDEKFDAIVQYGMEEDSVEMSKNYYVLPKDKETASLYQLLNDIGKGSVQFPDIKDKIHQLYTDALKSRQV